MTSKDQLLAHYIQNLGYLDKQQLQLATDSGLSLEVYLHQQKLLTQSQWSNFTFLFIEHSLLKYAQHTQQISETQCDDLFKERMDDIFMGKQITLLTKGLFSFQQIQKLANDLYAQKLFGHKEVRKTLELLNCPINLEKKEKGCVQKGERLNHYLIETELGRGGMGVVYKALDTRLERRVALKVITSSHISEKEIKRFLQETKAIAQLEHPNIVKLLDVGYTPQNYFTMEYIEGSTLKSQINSHQLELKQIAVVIQKIAQALYTAHQKKIIHRDIKPANVMINKAGEPKVMDFGLAKMANVESSLSVEGDIVGTPVYMPPEQAESKAVDKRADIYSLGATLYESLTGRPPFQGQTYINILHQIVDREPIAPRHLNPDIPIDLEVICLKCLEKEPIKRYQNALELSKDLQNFIDNKPISARPPGFLERATKWCYRHRVAASLFSLTLLSMLLTLWFLYDKSQTSFQLTQTNKKLKGANKELHLAQKQKQQALLNARQKLGEAHLQMTQSQIAIKNYTKAALNAMAAYKIFYRHKNKQRYLAHVSNILQYAILPNLPRLQQKFLPLGYPNIQLRGRTITSAYRGNIYSWDFSQISTEELQRQAALVAIGTNPFYHSVDGKLLAFTKQQSIAIYNIKSKKTNFIPLNHNEHPVNLTISPDNKWLAIKYFRKWVLLNILSHKKYTFPFMSHKTRYIEIVFASNSKQIALSYTGAIEVWQEQQGQWQNSLTIPYLNGTIRSIKFSPDNTTLISGDSKGRIMLYSFSQGSKIFLPAHRGKIFDVCFNHSGRLFASGGLDGKIILWNTSTRRQIFMIPLLPQKIIKIAFGPQSRHLFTLSYGSTIVCCKWLIEPFLWKTLEANQEGKKILAIIKKSGVNLNASFFKESNISNSGRFVAMPYFMTVVLWDLTKNVSHFILPGNSMFHPDVKSMSFSQDEKMLAVVYRNSKIIITSTENGQAIATLEGKKTISSDFLKDNTIVFSDGKRRSSLVFYDFINHSYRQKIDTKTTTNIIKVSPTGDWIALGKPQSTELWKIDIANKEKPLGITPVKFQLKTNVLNTTVMTWYSKGNKLAVGSFNTTRIDIIERHKSHWKIASTIDVAGGVYNLCFSPDGRYLAIFMESDIVIYDILHRLKTSTAVDYLKTGVANVAPDWKFIALPSDTGGLLLFRLQQEQNLLTLPPNELEQNILQKCRIK